MYIFLPIHTAKTKTQFNKTRYTYATTDVDLKVFVPADHLHKILLYKRQLNDKI